MADAEVSKNWEWIDEYFGSLILLVCGAYIAFFGFVYHPATLQKFTKRFHYFLVGLAFGVLFLLQAWQTHGDEPDLLTILTIVLPIVFGLFVGAFYYIGDILLGAYVFFLSTRYIEIAAESYDYANNMDGLRLAEVLGFGGALILYTLSSANFGIPLVFFQAVGGFALGLTGLACLVDGVLGSPVRVTDIQLDDAFNGNTYCAVSVHNGEMGIPFFVTIFVGAFITTALQISVGKLIIYCQPKDDAPKWSFSKVHKELAKANKEVRNEKAQHFLHSLWYYVRNRGEGVTFKEHEATLQLHLDELGLKERDLKTNEPDPNSQFIAVSDQLKMLFRDNVKMTPDEVRQVAATWLENSENWNLLVELEDDLFDMKHLDRKEYCQRLRRGAWGDFITLQALVEYFQTEIVLVTSVSEPALVHFPLIQKKADESKGKKVTYKKTAGLKDGANFTLVGFDGAEVVVEEIVAELSPVLRERMEQTKARKETKIYFENLSSRALRAIVEQLEAHYYIKKSASANPDVMAAYRHLDLMGKFGDDVGIQEEDDALVTEKKSMLMSHYWGFHYGSLEIGLNRPKPTDLDEKETRMRIWEQPYMKTIGCRMMIVLIIPCGLWWLVWMAVWGYNYNSFFEGVEFTLFFIAEALNFALGVVFNFNFWSPVNRKWRSINHLEPPFVEPVTVNCLISHYSEPTEDTERTVHGSLRMKTTEETILRVWICDDGFWGKPKTAPAPAPAPKKSIISRGIDWMRSRGSDRNAPGLVPLEGAENKEDSGSSDASEEMNEMDKQKPIPNFSETFKGEEDIMRGIFKTYGVFPTPLAMKMVKMLRKQLYRYYSEKLLTRVDIDATITLKTEEDIVRADCARASLKYVMYAKLPGTDTKLSGPEIVLVGRVKPAVHHYKAGNHNNCLFNEQMDGDFLMFLDNDMKPKPDFLLRTLPWFYYYHEPKKRYFINKGVSFIQTPQFFKRSTLAGERDHLGGRNGVFFQGIELGRDGFDLCAFAGTNAIFRLPPLHTIGGVPYGSLTEDAHTAYKLHEFGYRSIFVPDKLAVGVSPVTVANTMQQRGRWCKGSVQMFFLYMMPKFMCGLKKKEMPIWTKKNPFHEESKAEIALYGVPHEHAGWREVMRRFYAVDTTSWPFSAVTAIMYMLVAFIFLIYGKAPIYFDRSPLGYSIFLLTFLPYYLFKIVLQVLSYEGVDPNDVWVAQETWYSYSFASVYGIVDALKEHFTGTGLGGWGVTGDGVRTGKLEYCNFFVLVTLSFCILVRLFIWLLVDQAAIHLAAMFFAGVIVIHMWPVVATTMYEWVYNSHLKPEDKVDLRRFEVPKYVLFSGMLIFVIIISQFFD